MCWNELKHIFRSLDFEITDFGNNFLEFQGEMKDADNKLFSIVGSIEMENEMAVAYSLYFTDLTNNLEYDGMIGTINNPEKDSIVNLLTPNFYVIG